MLYTRLYHLCGSVHHHLLVLVPGDYSLSFTLEHFDLQETQCLCNTIQYNCSVLSDGLGSQIPHQLLQSGFTSLVVQHATAGKAFSMKKQLEKPSFACY